MGWLYKMICSGPETGKDEWIWGWNVKRVGGISEYIEGKGSWGVKESGIGFLWTYGLTQNTY